jgi:AraC-like DNA-binding protein
MLYSFVPTGDREVIDINSLIYTKPEKHPTRLLDFHDIFYLVEGKWSVLLINERIHMEAGDVMLLPAGFNHYGDKPCVPGTRSCYVHFSTKQGDGLASGKGEEETLPVYSHIHAGTTHAYSLLQDIMKTFQSNLPHRALRCSAILSLLICELSNPDAEVKTKQDLLILDILERIRERPERFFTIAELATTAGVSPKSLTMRFKAETGRSIHQYQIVWKLAYNFGFCDEFHLSSCFKKKFGVSPIHYSRGM